MKTIIVKVGTWLSIATFISLIIFVFNFNIVNRVDAMVNREDFEKFVNEKLTKLLQKENSIIEKKPQADSPEKEVIQDFVLTVDPQTEGCSMNSKVEAERIIF